MNSSTTHAVYKKKKRVEDARPFCKRPEHPYRSFFWPQFIDHCRRRFECRHDRGRNQKNSHGDHGGASDNTGVIIARENGPRQFGFHAFARASDGPPCNAPSLVPLPLTGVFILFSFPLQMSDARRSRALPSTAPWLRWTC